MKVLMLNGSPRPEGNTTIALREMEQIFQVEGVETELVQIGNRDIRGCIACNGCAKLGRCVF
ncbi:MAG: flavodoxin family protein, partial [Oscillibacter sp.]|nr:flavodoxin family protein [Oscillibacter sp.]